MVGFGKRGSATGHNRTGAEQPSVLLAGRYQRCAKFLRPAVERSTWRKGTVAEGVCVCWGNEGGDGSASLSIWRDNLVFVGDYANSAQDDRDVWSAASAGAGGGGEFAEGTGGLEVMVWYVLVVSHKFSAS